MYPLAAAVVATAASSPSAAATFAACYITSHGVGSLAAVAAWPLTSMLLVVLMALRRG